MFQSVILVLLGLAASCVAVDENPPREEFRIHARVQDVVMLSTFSGTVMPVGTNPRYAVTLWIESAAPVSPPFAAGTTLTFAVHSPSQLLGAADAKGRTYDFLLRRETDGEKTRVSSLEVVRP